MLKTQLISCVALGSFVAIANAADITPPPAESDWEFTIAPYGWLLGVNGNVQVGNSPTEDFSVGFSDILKKVEGGAMVAGEARNGRFSIGGDLILGKVSDEKSLDGIVGDKLKTTLGFTMLTGVFGYSLIYGDSGNLDVVAGARLGSVNPDLHFKGGGLLGGSSFGNTASWVDPIVGLKGHANITPDFYLTGWALIGGFGVSNDKLLWDVMGSVGYNFNDTYSMTVGYRGIGIDYQKNNLDLNTTFSGPMIGAVFKF